jgi:DivIVA domain-containing protein
MRRPDFMIVLRGYDREQVDEYLDSVERAEAGPPSGPTFRIAFRGYDRRGVDRYIEELLTAASPATPEDRQSSG